MSSTSQDAQPDSNGNLEDRMRGMLLDNNPSSISSTAHLHTTSLPPHLRMSSEEDKQEYFRKQAAMKTQQATTVEQNSGRKRLNQAQRRQGGSQLNYTVDARTSAHNQIPSGRGYPLQGDFHTHSQNSSSFNTPPRGAQGSQQSYQQGRQNYPQQHGSAYQSRPQFPQNRQANPMLGISQSQQGSGGNQSYGSNSNQRWGPPQQNVQQQSQYGQRPPQGRQLYQPGPYLSNRGLATEINPQQLASQSAFLGALINKYVPMVAIEDSEIAEKEAFRVMVEDACRDAIVAFELGIGNEKFDRSLVHLKCFGSMASGYATKASDVDLALLTPHSNPSADSSDSPIPRLLENVLLSMGHGARLLTKTRVPIIKLCEKPTKKLMSDLLEERQKWESGFIADVDHNDIVESSTSRVVEKDPLEKRRLDGDGASKTPEEAYQEALASLRQKAGISLGDYYGAAKRVLRTLGGRDVGAAYTAALNADDSRILTDVCKAFINGLEDKNLIRRLLVYKSMNLDDQDATFKLRSLLGIYNQVEGERLSMAWEERPLIEADPKLDIECYNIVQGWRTLMNKVTVDPAFYNRQIYHALERLRKISSLQLVFLEQGGHESAGQYYARVSRILNDLGGKFPSQNEQYKSKVAITYYMKGLGNSNIRDLLAKVTSQSDHMTLKMVANYHGILQLAQDYETGMLKKLFKKEDSTDINRYIALLKKGIESPDSLLATSANTPLLESILTLPDPTTAHKPRDRYSDHLSFPSIGVGIQCDINFSAQLALHNTLLLRCYSLTDSRVKSLILFIKHWAKCRGINTPYRGTLSSYGYVLMVLHYLINVVTPFVCPNLQHLQRDPPAYLPPSEIAAQTTCLGKDVRFWRNEKEIQDLANRGMLNHNKDSIGLLARGFFEYYAHNGQMSHGNARAFDWGREVLSLRTQGGLLTKQEKGWVGARVVMETTHESAPAAASTAITAPLAPNLGGETNPEKTPPTAPVAFPKKLATKEDVKEIRHRYLFAIEDPFELDHNVARTVTHNGIVNIRDEFRRAWRLIRGVGVPGLQEELLDSVAAEGEVEGHEGDLRRVLEGIHGVWGQPLTSEKGV